MLRTSLLLILCNTILIYPCGAQKGTSSTFVYSRLTLDLGSPVGYTASAACLFLKHHELSIGYNYYEREARGTPEDFENHGSFTNKNPLPYETMSGITIRYGYVLYPGSHADRIRFVMSGGALIGQYAIPDNYRRVAGGLGVGANYSYNVTNHSTAALILYPSFDYTPGRVFGVSAGVFAIVSERYSGMGVSVGILIGKTGNRRQHHKHRN